MFKNKIVSIIGVMLIVGICSLIISEVTGRHKEDTTEETTTSEDVVACTYADVDSLIRYLASSDEQRNSLDRLVDPLQKSDSINRAYIEDVVEIVGVSTDVYTGVLSGKKESDNVTLEEFEQIYEYIIASGEISGLARQDVYIFDYREITKDDGSVTKVVYDGEKYYDYDVVIDEIYNDRIIEVYAKDNKIFKILGFAKSEHVINNVWLISADSNGCTFMHDGVVKELMFQNKDGKLADVKDGCVADVTINNYGVIDYKAYTDIVDTRVVDIADGVVKDKDENTYVCTEDFVVYDVFKEPFCEENINLLEGHESVQLFMRDGQLAAAVIDDELISENIRVILNNDDYSSYDMNTATISCDALFKVTYPDESVVECAGGTTLTVDHRSYEDGDKIIFEAVDDESRLMIHSIKRSYGNPEYRGKLEVVITEDSLRIINELPLEEYLYSVVSNDVPANYSIEALKAIAVCARGYAYTRLHDNRYEGYGANLDDSSMCQVYNNEREAEEARDAVKATYGVVLKHNDKPIYPLYFSTSAGVTCTNDTIWGGNAYPYLKSNVEDLDKTEIDLSKEEDFIKFINDSMGYDTIEKELPYYRWDIFYTEDDMTEAIRSTLSERVSMSLDNIKVKDEDGDFVSVEEMDDIGEVLAIEITERSASGVVLTMVIYGSKAEIQVSGQTNIRNLITPVNQDIVRNDDSIVNGWTSLPSPYYYIEKVADGYIIHGGGFGHGAGMSQNGASVLADRGYDYKYILEHYFEEIEFEIIYDFEDEEDSDESE